MNNSVWDGLGIFSQRFWSSLGHFLDVLAPAFVSALAQDGLLSLYVIKRSEQTNRELGDLRKDLERLWADLAGFGMVWEKLLQDFKALEYGLTSSSRTSTNLKLKLGCKK